MDIKSSILKELNKKGIVRVADIVRATGFSRAYINRFFKELREEGEIELIGRANQAFYVLAKKNEVEKAKQKISGIRRLLRNKNLSEDVVLDEIKKSTGIFLNVSDNVSKILDYAFTEMLNNAIEHSRSRQIEVLMKRDSVVRFDVIDRGVGIFFNIMKKRKLKSELEAIQDLLKGKQTTAPKEHTGEGIFFTSKVADVLTIQSSRKKLIFNNILGDIFIKDNNKKIKGTKVTFIISLKSKTNLNDEVFRVWQSYHPSIKITYKNANENIIFMLKRALVKCAALLVI